MKLSLILILALGYVAVTLACDAKCKRQKALEKACSELGGGTKIKLEIDIAGNGGCRPPCKKKRKKAGEEEDPLDNILNPVPEQQDDPPPPIEEEDGGFQDNGQAKEHTGNGFGVDNNEGGNNGKGNGDEKTGEDDGW